MKRKKPQEDLVTKHYLNLVIKKETTKLRDEMHAIEYRLDTKIYRGFSEVNEKMDKHIDIIQKLVDKVLGAHNNFEVESASIKHNYQHLESRLTKVEEVIFPEAAST